MSTFTTPAALVSTPVAPGTILPVEAIPFANVDLDTRYIDGRNWLLLAEFDFASQTLERIIRIPIGFITDFASIPRIFWTLLPPTGRYGKAAVVHDYLYRTIGACSRKLADQTLLEAMLALRTPWLTREIIYEGVRLGGKGSYKGGC
jgi:hypothetical protein